MLLLERLIHLKQLRILSLAEFNFEFFSSLLAFECLILLFFAVFFVVGELLLHLGVLDLQHFVLGLEVLEERVRLVFEIAEVSCFAHVSHELFGLLSHFVQIAFALLRFNSFLAISFNALGHIGPVGGLSAASGLRLAEILMDVGVAGYYVLEVDLSRLSLFVRFNRCSSLRVLKRFTVPIPIPISFSIIITLIPIPISFSFSIIITLIPIPISFSIIIALTILILISFSFSIILVLFDLSQLWFPSQLFKVSVDSGVAGSQVKFASSAEYSLSQQLGFFDRRIRSLNVDVWDIWLAPGLALVAER